MSGREISRVNWPDTYTDLRRARVIAERLKKAVPPQKVQGVVVEGGCSIGETTKEFARLYPYASVYGFDILPRILPTVTTENVAFCAADIHMLPFAQRSISLLLLPNNLLWVHEITLRLLDPTKQYKDRQDFATICESIPLIAIIAYLSVFVREGGWLVLEKDRSDHQFRDMLLLVFKIQDGQLVLPKIGGGDSFYSRTLAQLANRYIVEHDGAVVLR